MVNLTIIETLRSGPFIFSSLYDHDKIQSNLIQAQVLFKTISDIPVLPDKISSIDEELIRKSIFGTAAIEGNPLPETEVNKILTEDDKKRLTTKAVKQICNLKKAYDFIFQRNSGDSPSSDIEPFPLSEDLIKKLHSMITSGSEGEENHPGLYRQHAVRVGDREHGGIYAPPKIYKDISTLMKEFIRWINSDLILKEDSIVRAALAHYHLALIHPFGDGNGRTARALEAMMLKKAGYRFVPLMLSNYYYRQLDGYYRAFSLSERNKENNITPFLEFYLQGMVSSLEEVKNRIILLVREMTLSSYYLKLRVEGKINERQYRLLLAFLYDSTHGVLAFTLQDLLRNDLYKFIYQNTTERTARRDLKNLVKYDLLKFNYSDSRYFFNLHVLG